MERLNLTLRGAEVLGPDGLHRREICVSDGRISDVAAGRVVDLSGYRILPGIVDLHGDGFERHLAPRRGAAADPGEGLHALDAELGACGITTAVLAQFWSWEGGMRAPAFARRLCAALAEARDRLVVDMAVQLRLETALVDDMDEVADFVAEAGIGYVVFNDHLPHAALAAGRRPPRLAGQALKSGRSPEAHLALLSALHARRAEVPAALDRLGATLAAAGVRLGSHDDASAEARAAHRERGAGIAEFPVSADAARAAHAAGDRVIMGAPNVVRGGSHERNLSAGEAVAAGWVDALASDYHYPSLARAALMLAERKGLAAAWALVSERPAQILGLSDRGVLAPGLRADLVVLDPGTGRIGATLAGGRMAHLAGEVAARFVA